ncbi:MAG TPA: CPBP family intramembrane glutamic endopeptidase [Tepidisphaeraceae bacterium]|jgi:membrane protease YdiL (CAAX protease family)
MAAARADLRRRIRLAAEVIFVFYGLPLAYVLVWRSPFVFGLLWVAAGLAFWLLWRDFGFDRNALTRRSDMRRHLRAILVIYLPACVGSGIAVAWLIPDRLFALPMKRPGLWAAIVIFYPLLSVYPQELIWRGLFFRRYATLFGSGRTMIMASALAFAWVHVVMLNPVAVWLTLAGGVLFGYRYDRSRSLVVVSIEHALYGLLVFTIGLGVYFVQGIPPPIP